MAAVTMAKVWLVLGFPVPCAQLRKAGRKFPAQFATQRRTWTVYR